MIILNPEFHRNLWLKFSPFRLAAMPVFLLGYFYITNFWSQDPSSTLFYAALPLCFIILGLFGNYEASNALSSEIKNNTWDFQKMSAIGPWQLTIGKLFGATSYAWYYAIPLLIIMAITYPHSEGPTVFLSAAICAAICGHASALLASLNSMHLEKMRSFSALFVGIVVSYWSFHLINGNTWYDIDQKTLTSTVTWFGTKYKEANFDIFTVLFVMFWVIVAIQRLMRLELQYKNTPIIWMAFTVSLSLYFAGLYGGSSFLTREVGTDVYALIAFFVTAALLYSKMLEATRDIMPYKRFISALKNKEWRNAFIDLPRWAATLVIALPLLVMVYMTIPNNAEEIEFSFFLLCLGILLFTLRDGLILHAILLGKRMRFTGFTILFYYFVMYYITLTVTFEGLMPSGGDFEKMITGGNSFTFFLPTGVGGFLNSCGPVILQSIAAAWFLHYRLKAFNKE